MTIFSAMALDFWYGVAFDLFVWRVATSSVRRAFSGSISMASWQLV